MSETYQESLIAKHRNKGLILDTNVLLLFVIGLYDRDYILKFKRTRQFLLEDFDLVLNLCRFFTKIYVTPQILGELTNFTDSIEDNRIKSFFVSFVTTISRSHESYVAKEEILLHPFLMKLGFSDISIMQTAKEKELLVLTEDFDLYGCLCSEGVSVINLNHIRSAAWGV